MKIALIGYGKMGHMIEEIALQRGHEIVCKIDVNNPEDIDSPEFCSADVAIEFTNPTAAYGNYLKAFSHNVKVVSGSTGWMKDHKEDVEKLCADGKQTLFWASNFSIGVAIFSAVNRYLAKIMNGFPQYSVCMQETTTFISSMRHQEQPSRLPRKLSTISTERRTGSVALLIGQRMVITMRAMQTSPMRIWLSTAYAMVRFLESTP